MSLTNFEVQIFKQLEEIKNLINSRLSQEKEILSLEEACTYLSITKSQIYMLTSKHLIAHSKPGGKKIYFKRVDLDDYALSNPIRTQAELSMSASQHILKNNPLNLN